MTTTFLHISDLHFRPNWQEGVGQICDQFFVDAKKQLEGTGDPYIIFSGDLVQCGEDEDHYSKFMEKFDSKLTDIGLPKERRICIPGNHDIARGSVDYAFQSGALSKIKTEKQFNDKTGKICSKLLADNLKLYCKYEIEFARYTCCSNCLSGGGWKLPNGIGVYCLNTAISSYGGCRDESGEEVSDKGKLYINTRRIQEWLAESGDCMKIMVMHHPCDWLVEWAQTELQKIIANSFDLVFSGHIHDGSTSLVTKNQRGSVSCVAPPLFTNKHDLLGYGFVKIAEESDSIQVCYRQWSSQGGVFVLGTAISGNDSGCVAFSDNSIDNEIVHSESKARPKIDTLACLEKEFADAVAGFSGRRQIWVDRELSTTPETNRDSESEVIANVQHLCSESNSCVIRAPQDHGLSCFGRQLSLEACRSSESETILAMLDVHGISKSKDGIVQSITDRCTDLGIEAKNLSGVILDHWENNTFGKRLIKTVKSEFPDIRIIVLESLSQFRDLIDIVDADTLLDFDKWYLQALTRSSIRELVTKYCVNLELDENAVTDKIVSDLDTLNIHRTPMNCLLLLKLAEQQFDESPVNRTELIGRVLHWLFVEFDEIPTYATRPDLKDCEYALGYLCEWLVREKKNRWSKRDFYSKIHEYCDKQLFNIDCDLLFAFLMQKKILVKSGNDFCFRFSYWIYYFAAHRMHHDESFCGHIFEDGRYSTMPGIIEFYTGIDRRRKDAVEILARDLKQMNTEFGERTKLPDEFNPFKGAQWKPSEESLAAMRGEIANGIAGSTLPSSVKDAIADNEYDRSRPYYQDMATFIDESSLNKMVQAMGGASRALRNSDHVDPESKMMLLTEVIRVWNRVGQILALFAPLLLEKGSASFEGLGFYLDESFRDIPEDRRWSVLLTVIPENVVRWYHDDLESQKMGALLNKYVESNPDGFGEIVVLLAMIKQKPDNWEKTIQRYALQASKNSFGLLQVYRSLHSQYRHGLGSERDRAHCKQLAATSLARHETGVKKPNKKLVGRAEKAIENQMKKGT